MVFVVHENSRFNLDRVLNNNKFDNWLFLGKDARKVNLLKDTILSKINKINISKILSESQYNNRDIYINYIDNLEYNTEKNRWWASTLACKNPWISDFYLSFSQIDVFNKIYEQQINANLLVVVEQEYLYRAIYDNYSKNSDIVFHSSVSDNVKLKHLVKRSYRFINAVPSAMMLKKKFNDIFEGSIYNFDNGNDYGTLLVPTFIDERSFRTGVYKDPFMGKVLDDITFKKHDIVIMPIVVNASREQLKLVNEWLVDMKYKVFFQQSSFNVFGGLLYLVKKIGNLPQKTNSSFLLNYNISALINHERNNDWANFDMQTFLFNEFSFKFSKVKGNKLLIYPFENQKWERCLLFALKNTNSVYSVGIQNAPSPLLSLRYFVSKKVINHIPLPDTIIATGKVSYENIFDNYKTILNVYQSNSSRSFLSFDNTKSKNDIPRVLVGCSIGLLESIELITFVISALKEIDVLVNIVPHPQVRFNYEELLNQIGATPNIKLSNIGFSKELEMSDFVLFDSSTVGLEAMSNNITPVFIGHEYSVHVNPNEFDSKATKYVYSTKELKELMSVTINNDNLIEISKNYFGDRNTESLSDVLKKINLQISNKN